MSLNILKKELESALLIREWSPTEIELKEIARQLKEFRGEPTRANVANIVLGIVSSCEALALEGEDNSDLTTLLLLATKTISSND